MWLLKEDVARAMRDAKLAGIQPTEEERAKFADAMRETYAGKSAEQSRNLKIAGNVAQIDIDGVLTEKPDCLALLFGGGNTTYSSIRKALAQADADPNVQTIVLNISSPGGQVTGLFETFAALEGTKKPMSVRASLAASAAYGLAAVAGPIQAVTPASEFGSIGVAVRLFMDEDVVDIASTEAPRKRPDYSTEEGQAVIREELDAFHELFVDAIARGRGTKSAAVNAEFGRGGVLLAKQAQDRGMIDSIAAQPRRARAGKRAEENDAEPSEAPPKQAADGGTTEIATMTIEQLKAQHPELYKAVGDAAVAEERDRVGAHLEAGEASGDMKTAVEAIRSGTQMTQTLMAKYMMAGRSRGESEALRSDGEAATAVLKGAATPKPNKAPSASADALDAGVDLYLAKRGKAANG
jgi:ClpP class serine protease